MPKISRQVGTTSQLVDIEALNSGSTTGAGLTGLAFGTSGLTCYYHRNTANASVSVTLATMTLGTWATGGFIVVDGTNMPGLYQFGIPNAALASGADTVIFYFQGATNLAPMMLEIELTAVNNQSTAFGLSIAKTTNITGFNDLTAAAIATGVWQDTTSGDFTTASSIGKSLYTGGVAPGGTNGLFIAGTNAATTITTSLTTHIVGTVDTVTTVTNQLTAAAIATGVWQDSTSGDFTAASSIGKSLYTSGAVPGAANGLFIAGSNAVTTVNITGSLSGSVGSVSGSVGSVTGAVGSVSGNVTGSVGSVTGNVGGNVVGSTASVTAAVTVSLTQTLNAARALDAIADTSLTLNDALQCAVGSICAQMDASGGTSLVIKTASTGQTLRTKTLTLISPPSTVPDKAV